MVKFFVNVALLAACFLHGVDETPNLHLLEKPDLITDKSMGDETIRQVYENFVHVNNTPDYLNRYHPLPRKRNTRAWPWEKQDLPRIFAVMEFQRFIKENNISAKKALFFNGTHDRERHILPIEHLDIIEYDGTLEKDLHYFDLGEYDYDFVSANQTLEHVWNPEMCLQRLFRHLKRGGILYLNVPALNRTHCTPFYHYAGITPVGLGMLVLGAGFKILEIGQFGNTEYIHALFSRKDYPYSPWPNYTELKNPGKNEFNRPAISWIFAIKE